MREREKVERGEDAMRHKAMAVRAGLIGVKSSPHGTWQVITWGC